MRMLAILALLGMPVAASGGEDARAAVAEATKAIDAGDAAFNAHDAKAMIALLDVTYFSCGPRASTCINDAGGIRRGLESGFQRGAAMGVHAVRDKLQISVDDSGSFAWFIADYTFHVANRRKGPTDRLVRESGALVKRGGQWRFVMLHNAWPLPDEPAASK
jgi:hypothetical protein